MKKNSEILIFLACLLFTSLCFAAFSYAMTQLLEQFSVGLTQAYQALPWR